MGPKSASWFQNLRSQSDSWIQATDGNLWDGFGWTLVDSSSPRVILDKGMAQLESGRDDPQSSVALAAARTQVRDHGMGGAFALNLAARMVKLTDRLESSGLRRVNILDGLASASRQISALLELVAKAGTWSASGPLAPIQHDVEAWIMSQDEAILDDIVILERETGLGARFEELIPISGEGLREGEVRIATITGSISCKPKNSISATSTSRMHLLEIEESLIAKKIAKLGVDFLICSGQIAPGIQQELWRAGVSCKQNCSKKLLGVIAAGSGATLRAGLVELNTSELGIGSLSKQKGDWFLEVPDVAAVITLPPKRIIDEEYQLEAELRLLGSFLASKRVLEFEEFARLASTLRKSSASLPNRTPLVWDGVAEYFEELRLHQFGAPTIPAAALIQAIRSGFDAAIALLRIDQIHEKPKSNSTQLRGSDARAGSPKNMPGDIPPLM